MAIEIEGVPPFDGSYEFDLEAEPLTMWDFHIIKKISGARGREVAEAFAAGDVDVVVAFAVIALKRAGKTTKDQAVRVAEALSDAEAGKIRLVEDEEAAEDDASPPVTASGEDSSRSPSGPDSNGTGDVSPATPPPATGFPV